VPLIQELEREKRHRPPDELKSWAAETIRQQHEFRPARAGEIPDVTNGCGHSLAVEGAMSECVASPQALRGDPRSAARPKFEPASIN
jgi:hypothetical protein